MLERIFKIYKELDGSIFLFGGRQTGKTTLLRQQFPDTTFFDLLDTNVRRRHLTIRSGADVTYWYQRTGK